MTIGLKQQLWLTLLVAAAAVGNAIAGDLPDPRLTPGALNPDVTQANVQTTVCVKGWTKTVRPAAFYTNKLKKVQLREYGYADTNPRDYEEDHLVPLSVGGHPTDPKNLWPQPRSSEWNADKKDKLEFALYRAVCRGEITLDAAREAFRSDWIAAYRKYQSLLAKYRYGHTD